MTKKKELSQNNIKIGKIIKRHREALQVGKSRQKFIDDRVKTGIVPEGWISVKSLTNIELGNNVPSLKTLKLLSIALEVELPDLIMEIIDYI